MTVFAFKSVDFVSEKGVATKKSLPPVKVFLFFCEIRSSHIFPAVSPQRGLTSILLGGREVQGDHTLLRGSRSSVESSGKQKKRQSAPDRGLSSLRGIS